MFSINENDEIKCEIYLIKKNKRGGEKVREKKNKSDLKQITENISSLRNKSLTKKDDRRNIKYKNNTKDDYQLKIEKRILDEINKINNGI